jgi:putative endonuclease
LDNKRALGQSKEKTAADYLVKKGYRILDMNYQVRQAELDIVAQDGKVLVFVEVKFRRNHSAGHPLSAVTPSKQKKICKASVFYMNAHRINPDVTEIRYDVIGILGDEIFHVENAFPYV